MGKSMNTEEFQHWLITQEWNISEITYEYFGMTSKGIAMSDLSEGQKEYLLGMRQKKVIADMVQRASMSRDKRKRFYDTLGIEQDLRSNEWFIQEGRGKIIEHKLEKIRSQQVINKTFRSKGDM